MNEWKSSKEKLERDFIFKDFKEALEFVNKVGSLAEEEQHHPDIFIYGYRNVRITLSTHSAGKVTEKDFKLAGRIDELA